ncbi:ATP-binding protein [Blautia schinkii]|nr:ATP-binding protein [Blautia schinkii]
MKEIRLPVGVSDFRKIREEGSYYIDKTGLIEELLKTKDTEVTLITRPRRFGKTLAMSMLAHFFDIREDSAVLFQGLKVSENKELCGRWMNRYPVLFISFKDIDGRDFSIAYERLQGQLVEVFKKFDYLLKSDLVNEEDKRVFSLIKSENANQGQVSRALSVLMSMLAAYYGKPVILLLDEYDVPVAKANLNGYYREMLDVIKGMLSTALKDNPSLQFAVVSGCLRITKESIFTGTNNFTTDTISDRRYDEYFGFTNKEVKRLLLDAGLEERLELVQQWYDGYRFGDMDIYCPWDVLNYVDRALVQGMEKPQNFWANTSDNAVIGQFLDRTDFDVTEKFETLLSGGYIIEAINESLTYDFLTSSEENLWSLLYMTGYLTRVKKEDAKDSERPEDKYTALRIPNAEVQDIFRKSVVEWFNKKAANSDRQELFHALWNGETEKLTKLLSDLLFDTISFHDYAESFYHAFVTGLVAGAGYIVESNYENGLGRPDIVIKDRSSRRALVIEAKIASSKERLDKECRAALLQIEKKEYARKIERSGFHKVICYGIAFYKKDCMVKSLEK